MRMTFNVFTVPAGGFVVEYWERDEKESNSCECDDITDVVLAITTLLTAAEERAQKAQ
jgi:hypothetical protein